MSQRFRKSHCRDRWWWELLREHRALWQPVQTTLGPTPAFHLTDPHWGPGGVASRATTCWATHATTWAPWAQHSQQQTRTSHHAQDRAGTPKQKSKLSSAQQWGHFRGNHAFQLWWCSLSYTFTTLCCLLPLLSSSGITFSFSYVLVHEGKKYLLGLQMVLSPSYQSFVSLWARSFCQPIFILDVGGCTCLTKPLPAKWWLAKIISQEQGKDTRVWYWSTCFRSSKNPWLHCKQQQIMTCAASK